MSTNTGRYKTFANAAALHGPAGGGQNLNEDLQKRLGDDLDGLVAALGGDGVTGGTGWVVAPGAGLAVTISAGEGFAGGQRCKSTGVGGVAVPASTAGIKIYVTAGAPWDGASVAWPTTFGATTGALTAGQLLLAEVTTDGSGVTVVVDKRVYVQPQTTAFSGLDDTVTAAAAATSIRQRFGMLASRIREIIGGGENSWLATIGGNASLAVLWSRFQAVAQGGHSHTGSGEMGPKLAQADTHESPDTDGGPTALHHTLGGSANQAAPGVHTHPATAISYAGGPGLGGATVEAALDELAAEKTDVGHTHAAADITSGAFAPAQIGTGTPTARGLVFGDGAWREVSQAFGPNYAFNPQFQYWLRSHEPLQWEKNGGLLAFRQPAEAPGPVSVGLLPHAPVTTHLLTNGSTSQTQNYNTASITPAANALIMVWVITSRTSGTAGIPTLTGNNLTWVQVDTVTVSTKRLTLFRAMGAAPTSGQVAIAVAGDSSDGCLWSFTSSTHVHQGGTHGSSAVKAFAKTSATLAVSVDNLSRIAFVGRNLVSGHLLNGFAGAPDWGAPGHTTLGTDSILTPSLSIATEKIDRPEINGTWLSWHTDGTHMAVIVVELAEDSTEAVTPDTCYLSQRVDNIPGFPSVEQWQGRQATAGAWVFAAAANTARVGVSDGTAVSWSAYHPGDSAWHLLTVTRTFDAGATEAAIRLGINTNVVAYFGSAALVFGAVLGDTHAEYWPIRRIPSFIFAPDATYTLGHRCLVTALTIQSSTTQGFQFFLARKNGLDSEVCVTHLPVMGGHNVNLHESVEYAAGDFVHFVLGSDGAPNGFGTLGFSFAELP